MIRSMTGFATCEAASPLGALGAEMRAVNHRFLELGLRLPEELRSFEPAIRERIGARLSRGKVDLSLRLRGGDRPSVLAVDDAALDQLAAVARKLAKALPAMSIEFTRLLEYPGVLKRGSVDSDELSQSLLALIDATVDAFIAAREREGAKLAQVILERLDAIAAVVAMLDTLLPELSAAWRDRLRQRLALLAETADPGRIEQEIVIQSSKSDVAEELDRLRAHISEARRVLSQPEPAGRRLDFLLQEFNREANTLASKSFDQRTTDAGIELKVLIEQIREQVQNIE